MSGKSFSGRLQDAGLYVEFEDPSYTQWRILQLLDGKDVPFLRYCTIHNTSPILQERTTSIHFDNTVREPRLHVLLSFTDRAWHVFVMESHGGVAEGDFNCVFKNFEDVERTALHYYFGNPTIINNWVVPLHRHPELDTLKVEVAIRDATVISAMEFKNIILQQEQAGKEKRYASVWEEALEHTFIYILHLEETHHICALRRNAQQAYIIPSHSSRY